jgi:hypothetical protein
MTQTFHKPRPIRVVGCAALVLLTMATVEQAHASPMDFSFGTVQNYNYEGLGGFCVAASFINGATYLQNAYPSVYGGTRLATGPESTPAAAALDYAYNGWTSPQGTSFAGYYTRVNQDNGNLKDWWQTTIDWTESYAPGKTAYFGQAAAWLGNENPSTWTLGSNVSDNAPTCSFLRCAATNNDFVELAIYGYQVANGSLSIIGGHAIDLANITRSQGVYTLTYQDPNFPTSQFLSAQLNTITIDGQQFLTFYDPNTFGANVFIDAAFAEAPLPAPEPCTLVLVLSGAMAMIGYAWRKRNRAA